MAYQVSWRQTSEAGDVPEPHGVVVETFLQAIMTIFFAFAWQHVTERGRLIKVEAFSISNK